jgi:hypothetical protein
MEKLYQPRATKLGYRSMNAPHGEEALLHVSNHELIEQTSPRSSFETPAKSGLLRA